MWRDLFDHPHLLDLLAAPREDDDAYQRWLRATVTSLAKQPDASPHEIRSDDERQWIDRAVAERLLAWAPGRDAVVLGEAWAEARRRERTPYETWLRGVHAAAAREPYPITGDQEHAWAMQAVAEGALAWDIEGVSLVPPKTGDDGGTPYR